MKRLKVLIVEDDRRQYDMLVQELNAYFHGLGSYDLIETEHDFLHNMDQIVSDPPDLVLVDVMLPWTRPTKKMPEPPEEVKRERFFRAGVRCVKRLRERQETQNIPIILYTILGRSDLSQDIELYENVTHVQKTKDWTTLIEKMCEVVPVLHEYRR